jgi:pimeloyl-ACP methyl ester carboxylesterase
MKLVVAGSDVYVYTGTRPLDALLPTVVFIHGAAHDHSVWSLQSRYFAHHGHNVLAIDLPGHGRSGGAPLGSVEAIADWIPALLDAVGVGAAALVGHSMGSLAALDCAGRHHDRVSKLALIGPAAPMPVSEALLDAAKRDEHLAFDLITGWSYSAGKRLGGNTVPGVWLMGNAMRLLERSAPGALHADLVACNAYAAGVDAAAKVRSPALVVVGGRDIMAPRKNALALIAALPEVRAVELPDCGHALMAEAPDAVLDALRTFL